MTMYVILKLNLNIYTFKTKIKIKQTTKQSVDTTNRIPIFPRIHNCRNDMVQFQINFMQN